MPVRPVIMLFFVGLCALSMAGCADKTKTARQDRSNPADSALPSAARDSLVIELAGRDSVTAFDLLKEAHQVDYRSTMGGVFVLSVDSVKNSTAAFWIYSVNDSMPPIAADRKITHGGDRVKWHFRKSGKP